MRLSFGNGEHADFVVENGVVSLGHAEGNTFVLSDRDVASQHARLTVDVRGAVLEVLDPGARTHLNARPVREKALLRCGDVLCLGRVTIALKADRDELVETVVPPQAERPPPPLHPPRVILRGVSGSHYGKTIAVNHRLAIGSASDCGLVVDEARIAPHHAELENVGDAIYLRATAADGTALVNGVRVREAIVYPGDQLAFERSHFVIEAPGLPTRGAAALVGAKTETMDVVGDGVVAAEDERSQGAIWWLIGVAALIAAGIALMIWRGSGA